jgi:hypothetical protein
VTVEQLREGLGPAGGLEAVVLLDGDPGKLPAFPRQLVVAAGELLSSASSSSRAACHCSCVPTVLRHCLASYLSAGVPWSRCFVRIGSSSVRVCSLRHHRGAGTKRHARMPWWPSERFAAPARGRRGGVPRAHRPVPSGAAAALLPDSGLGSGRRGSSQETLLAAWRGLEDPTGDPRCAPGLPHRDTARPERATEQGASPAQSGAIAEPPEPTRRSGPSRGAGYLTRRRDGTSASAARHRPPRCAVSTSDARGPRACLRPRARTTEYPAAARASVATPPQRRPDRRAHRK